ncbi:hypothetical protein FRC14_006815 [Serendipita sp. 396]|nr:hypothetical protein FRC14_006815 [Serendipita sp. 396]
MEEIPAATATSSPRYRLKFSNSSKSDNLAPLYSFENPLGIHRSENLPYVTHLQSFDQSCYLVVFSAPEDTVAIFDPSTNSTTGGAQIIGNYKPHLPESGVTKLKLCPTNPSHLFWTSGTDGRVVRTDVREQETKHGKNALKGKWAHKRPFLSMDVSSNGNMVVAGTEKDGEDASIVFWDPRNSSKPLATHTSTHSDDITTLSIDRYHTGDDSARYLLSGSTDCLLSLTNLSAITNDDEANQNPAEEDSEDDAIERVANWGCSIARTGWIPDKAYKFTVPRKSEESADEQDSRGRIWSTSDMETMALWSDQAKAVDHQWKTDYVIDAGYCDKDDHPGPWGMKGLLKWCGTNDGNIALLQLSSKDPSKWNVEQRLIGGHSEIVRCVSWDKQGLIVTGGEDGKLAFWRQPEVDHDEDGDVEMKSMANAASPSYEAYVGEQARRRRPESDDDESKVHTYNHKFPLTIAPC